ncbi:divalent-cation tolerance protein CutA [Nitrososphaera sp. AFS]|uniref:divalent-cation tolerance protein CutA n=1 Tax=Nitrososphaera sp. AFS TaxID=2301191 RepID=UPI00351B7A55
MTKNLKSGVVIMSTFPSEESLRGIALEVVVNKKICACVNYVRIKTLYKWQGKVEDSEEFLTIFKTTNQHSQELKAEIKLRHPYEIPEVVELTMDDVSDAYMNWMMQSTNAVS